MKPAPGTRFHVRGYCEKSQGFRDLVLSRFRGEAEIEGPSPHSIDKDEAWQTSVTLILSPDPRLSPAQRDVLANDYQMENGTLHIKTRAALADYLLRNAGEHQIPRWQTRSAATGAGKQR